MSSLHSYKAAWRSSSKCQNYGRSSLLLFALSIRYNIDDIDSLAATSLTEGADDKCIDAIFLDSDSNETAVIIQSYVTDDETKPEAPSSKAADLNTAITWAFNLPLERVPDRIRPNVEALREALSNNEIENVEFWYVHNLNESSNVQSELGGVEASAHRSIKDMYPGYPISIRAIEVGNNRIEEWFLSQTNPIVISDIFEIDVVGGYEIEIDDWKSYTTAISANWLYDLYNTYKEKLFSANIRGYLGSRRTDRNINNGIKQTCESEPTNFWVYNNGITCLVHNYEENNNKLKLTGLAIVNGAQTTGAIGSLSNAPNKDALIPTRFIVCENTSVLEKIIRYNNSQNKIDAADFRSNDRIQRRLREEFSRIPEANYTGRRGGARDAIRRDPTLIPRNTVAQTLAAFHGDPILAYNRKSRIWEMGHNYVKYFNENTTAKHIVFVYSLLRAIENKKWNLKQKSELTEAESNQLDFFRKRGPIQLVMSTASTCMETIISRPIPNKFKISFGEIAPSTGTEFWNPIIDVIISFSRHLYPAVENGLKNEQTVIECNKAVRDLVESIKGANKSIFDEFSEKIVFDT